MQTLWPALEPLLGTVERPVRYIGGEWGAVDPRHGPGRVSWLLVYPDVYELGIANQGLQILYEILNERPDAVAERAYAPGRDLEAALRAAGLPLFSVDGHHPAAAFDVVGFTLPSELTATNVVNLVDLAGLALRSDGRGDTDPLVLAGGHGAVSPEPLAPFVDAFVLGDGEEVVGEITEALAEWSASRRAGGRSGARRAALRALAGVRGVYVAPLYRPVWDAGGHQIGVEPTDAAVPERVERRAVADLAAWPHPRRPLVPLTEVVHDRFAVEVFRGCTRGCRFCQAGMITRPVRERPPAQVRALVAEGVAASGADEVGLTSLSSADYSALEAVLAGVRDDAERAGAPVSLSLPSLRVDAFTVGIAAQLATGRRTGLTFAPEAGTWRLRQVINKLVRDEDLLEAVEAAFARGWRHVKLYFLIGLPTETDDDTRAIAEVARACADVGRRVRGGGSVTVSVGGFVPKAHTPFQWARQDTLAEHRRRLGVLRDAVGKGGPVRLRWHDPGATLAEGLLARGDRRTGDVLEAVWRAGGTFQEWSEHFDLRRWLDAAEAAGVDLDWYVHRRRDVGEPLPWSHLSVDLDERWLAEEWALAQEGAERDDCRWSHCYDCGVCTEHDLDHVLVSVGTPGAGAAAPAGGLAVAGTGGVPAAGESS